MYQLDISLKKLKKIFPLDSVNNSNLIDGLSSLSIQTVSRGLLHYNPSLRTYLIGYSGLDSNGKMFVADFYIKEEDQLNLVKIDLYRHIF